MIYTMLCAIFQPSLSWPSEVTIEKVLTLQRKCGYIHHIVYSGDPDDASRLRVVRLSSTEPWPVEIPPVFLDEYVAEVSSDCLLSDLSMENLLECTQDNKHEGRIFFKDHDSYVGYKDSL